VSGFNPGTSHSESREQRNVGDPPQAPGLCPVQRLQPQHHQSLP
jgi:hypothetical protein